MTALKYPSNRWALRFGTADAAELDDIITQIPWRLWGALLTVAVLGSVIYGASLALVLPEWTLGSAAAWLTLSAGLGWCGFIPVVCSLTSGYRVAALTTCLATMAVGEVVLLAGAAINALASCYGGLAHPQGFNLGVVICSNLVMATVFAKALRHLKVPLWKSIAAWILVLNGGGLLCFWFLAPWLRSL